jgi:hypothetical protein
MDFYALSWCPSTKGREYNPDTYGVSLRDTKISESPFSLSLGYNKDPGVVCEKHVSTREINQFVQFIKKGYRYKLYADDLPCAVYLRHPDTGELVADYDKGIPVGYWDKDTKEAILYNHLDIRVRTHIPDGTKDEYRIVGFEVYPKSIKYGGRYYKDTLDEQPNQVIVHNQKEGHDLLFTYTTT